MEYADTLRGIPSTPARFTEPTWSDEELDFLSKNSTSSAFYRILFYEDNLFTLLCSLFFFIAILGVFLYLSNSLFLRKKIVYNFVMFLSQIFFLVLCFICSSSFFLKIKFHYVTGLFFIDSVLSFFLHSWYYEKCGMQYHVVFLYNFFFDRLSSVFLFLTVGIFCLVFLYMYKKNIKKYVLFIKLFLVLECIVLLCFSTINILFFFVFFESTLPIMFIIIQLFGSSSRRVRAAFLLFIYTTFGSVLFFFSIIIIFLQYGTFNILEISMLGIGFFDGNLVVWFFIFIAFAIKIPTFPFYLWLPEAHVEAPTGGSVILASILSKLGSYGLFRFLFIPFFKLTLFMKPFILLVGLMSIVFAAFSIMRQTDIKRIIAYSSIIHMNSALIGLASMSLYSVIGAFVIMVGHGLVSSGLFFLVGFLYDRYHTRSIKYYSGLANYMPLMNFFFFFFTLANVGVPFTVNFVAEFLIFEDIVNNNFFLSLLLFVYFFINCFFSINLYTRMFSGNFCLQYLKVTYDVDEQEFLVLFVLSLFIFLFGVFPVLLINFLLGHIDFFIHLTFFSV